MGLNCKVPKKKGLQKKEHVKLKQNQGQHITLENYPQIVESQNDLGWK